MIEIRFHGRGGQGVVVASKILAVALFKEGKYVQSFPDFGVERRGAPVTAFTRIDNKPINLRTFIYEPDHIVVLDHTLIEVIDVLNGLKKGGWILINSSHKPDYYNFKDLNVVTVDANKIAVKYKLGSPMYPIVNTSILGAFAKITGLIGIKSLKEAIKEESPNKIKENILSAIDSYNMVRYSKS